MLEEDCEGDYKEYCSITDELWDRIMKQPVRTVETVERFQVLNGFYKNFVRNKRKEDN